mmetsp:Transcript_7538/g.18545  ORF Transcript_7538/g.18545 Transcript_7538/m.18545 type:complete len:207 (-) Transcript_7538:2965-3585(-)
MSCITNASWRRSSFDLTMIPVRSQPGLHASGLEAAIRDRFSAQRSPKAKRPQKAESSCSLLVCFSTSFNCFSNSRSFLTSSRSSPWEIISPFHRVSACRTAGGRTPQPTRRGSTAPASISGNSCPLCMMVRCWSVSPMPLGVSSSQASVALAVRYWMRSSRMASIVLSSSFFGPFAVASSVMADRMPSVKSSLRLSSLLSELLPSL